MNKSKRILFLSAAILSLLAAHAFAQSSDGNPANWCRNGAFPSDGENFRLARITGKAGEKVYFYDDTRDDCPDNKNCRMKSYVIPGNEVIVSRTYGNWVCSWYQPRKRSETVGWIALDKLQFIEPSKSPAMTEWLGEWLHYDNSINIARSKNAGFLDITGDATWRGLGDNVHVGELDESVKPKGNTLKIGENDSGEYDCKVTMRLVGRFLVVSDNLSCGGLNVTFSGVYQKK